MQFSIFTLLLVMLLKYFLQCGNNMKSTNQGSLRDKTAREQHPDRRLLAGMWAPGWQNTLRIRLMRLFTLVKNGDNKTLQTAIFFSSSQLLEEILPLWRAVWRCLWFIGITSLAIIASHVCVHYVNELVLLWQ